MNIILFFLYVSYLTLAFNYTVEALLNMNTLNFTYDKTEKCMTAKVHNADLTSLKNIIDTKL